MDELRFVIYDKNDQFQCQLIPDGSVDLIPNGISMAQFTLDDDHPKLAKVTAPGARCAILFRGAERMRGRVSATPTVGPDGTMTVSVEGDSRKLWDWLGWPKPAAALNAQTDEYRHISAVSETLFKTALSETVTRLGVPWVVATTHGWGTAAVADIRMHPLGDKIVEPLTRDNLIIALTYSGGHVHVDVRQASTVPGVMTLDTGVPDSYKTDSTAPAATRVIVGGRGEGVEREFVSVIDPGRELAWGDVIERFIDARNTDEGSDIGLEGVAALADAAPGQGVSFELVETDRFRYGTTYTEGDLLHVRLGPVDVTERISKVSITQSRSDGVVVAPFVGAIDTDDTDVQLAEQISRLARGQRDQGRR